jgi:hypothetical protein
MSNYDNDEYPWGNCTYDSEDCYGEPYKVEDTPQNRQNYLDAQKACKR